MKNCNFQNFSECAIEIQCDEVTGPIHETKQVSNVLVFYYISANCLTRNKFNKLIL